MPLQTDLLTVEAISKTIVVLKSPETYLIHLNNACSRQHDAIRSQEWRKGGFESNLETPRLLEDLVAAQTRIFESCTLNNTGITA